VVTLPVTGGDAGLSGIYVGRLRHRRFTPQAHSFEYPTFMVLLDVDRIPSLMRVSRFTSYNRWNWATFDDRDHLGHPRLALRERLARDAAARGLSLPDGAIYLLTHLRYAGYCFNPVSFFYCFDRDGRVRLILAEVNNTYGGSHRYWLQPRRDVDGRTFRASTRKSLYVSPFMPDAMHYDFVFTRPDDRLAAHMTVSPAAATADAGPVFDATLTLERRAWNAREIRRVLVRHPLETVSVVAAIHWQALRLWLKGVPVQPRRTPNGVAPRAAELAGGLGDSVAAGKS
jgi:DUF1365 family protein